MTNWYLWGSLIALIGVPFGVITGFIFCATVKRLIDTPNVSVPWFILAVAYFWYGVGLICDALFNAIYGTWIFREIFRVEIVRWHGIPLPDPELFTHRIQRHVREPAGWRRIRADRWAAILNAVVPNHIKLP